jgi:hypothetical protein
LDFVEALLEPVGVVFVTGKQAEGAEGGAGFGFVGGEFFEGAAVEHALEAESEGLPLLLRREVVVRLELGRRELVEEIFPELEKFFGGGLGGCRRGSLRGERQREETGEGRLEAAVHVTARDATRLRPLL